MKFSKVTDSCRDVSFSPSYLLSTEEHNHGTPHHSEKSARRTSPRTSCLSAATLQHLFAGKSIAQRTLVREESTDVVRGVEINVDRSHSYDFSLCGAQFLAHLRRTQQRRDDPKRISS